MGARAGGVLLRRPGSGELVKVVRRCAALAAWQVGPAPTRRKRPQMPAATSWSPRESRPVATCAVRRRCCRCSTRCSRRSRCRSWRPAASARARGMAAAIAAGADAVRVGTRFLAAEEADVHPSYAECPDRGGPRRHRADRGVLGDVAARTSPCAELLRGRRRGDRPTRSSARSTTRAGGMPVREAVAAFARAQRNGQGRRDGDVRRAVRVRGRASSARRGDCARAGRGRRSAAQALGIDYVRLARVSRSDSKSSAFRCRAPSSHQRGWS